MNDENKQTPRPATAARTAREERLAAALRDNLKRRKDQSRARDRREPSASGTKRDA